MSYKIIFAKMQKCKTFRNTLNINALSKHENRSFFAFSAFCPQKPPFWAFLIAIFAFLMHEKATLMRENLPLMDGNPGFVHPPLFERGKTEHEEKAFSRPFLGLKTGYRLQITGYGGFQLSVFSVQLTADS